MECKMDSTSYAEDKTKGMIVFDWLKIQLERAKRKGKPVYVLGFSIENHIYDLEETIERIKKIPGIYDVIPVNGTIECIAFGTEKEIKGLVRKVYIENLGDEIGCVEYTEEDKEKIDGPYGKVIMAIRLARRNGEQWHFYDEATESFEALMAEAESKLGKSKDK